MRFSSSFLGLSFLLTSLGCAPISEVMRADMESAQYTDVIERGEGWLQDASLERQATQEGRSVHRFVAEAYLGLAVARGRLSDFEAFRQRYEKFSAYEDLLTTAYEEAAKVALLRKVGTNPAWEDFEWFEARYGQSKVVGQARARVLTAELGRLRVNPTIEGYRALRRRFTDWVEFKPHREELLEAEATHYVQTLLLPGATLEVYRTYALTYPDHMTPTLVSELTKLELARAGELDDLEHWVSLEGRYTGAWSVPLKADARSGVLAMKIRDAVQTNTTYAFDALTVEYAESTPRLLSEITQAQCRWMLDQISSLSEMRQAVPREKGLYLLSLMSRDDVCSTQVSTRTASLSEAARTGDIWANRILRRLNGLREGTPMAPLTRNQEAALFWERAQASNRVVNLRDMIDWYGDSTFGEDADKKLVSVRQAERRRGDRLQSEVIASQNGRRGRQVNLVNLVDQFHGPVSVASSNLELVDSTVGRVMSVKPIRKSFLWFTGQMSEAKQRTEFRTQLMTFKRYFSLYDVDITTGVITQRGRRLRWQTVKQTDRLLDKLSTGNSRILPASFNRLSNALIRRSIASNVLHIVDSKDHSFGNEVCASLADDARKACHQSALNELALKPLEGASQQSGLLSTPSQTSVWAEAFKRLGISTESVTGFESIGLKIARASIVSLRDLKGSGPPVTQFNWRPKLVWHWQSELDGRKPESNDVTTSPETSEATRVKLPWKELEGAEVNRFNASSGEVAVVAAKGETQRRMYVRRNNGEWRLDKALPVRPEYTVLHASLINVEGLDVVRVLSSNHEVHDWRMVDAQWKESTAFVHLKGKPGSTDSASVSKFGTPAVGLKHRGRIILAGDSTQGMWRSLDGGRHWRHGHQGRRFDQLGQYQDESVMVCARVMMLDSNLKGIECSQDDGVTWQRLLTTVKPISLSRRNGELVVDYEGVKLRLGRLIDEGTIRSELLFLGKTARLSQTGQWFGGQLEQRVSAAKDRLLVSRPLKVVVPGGDESAVKAAHRPLPMVTASAEVFELPTVPAHTEKTWAYAIIGSIVQTQRRQ